MRDKKKNSIFEEKSVLFLLKLISIFLGLGILSYFLFDRKQNNVGNLHTSSLDNSEFLPSPDVQKLLQSHLSERLSDKVVNAKSIYVIPGGGAGTSANSVTGKLGYPLWTSYRIVEAYKHYTDNMQDSKAIFFALSAGSLNNGNSLSSDRRIIFECQHMVKHLIELGVDSEIVFGDFMSWDTVTNGLSLRLFIEGLLSAQSLDQDSQKLTSNNLKKKVDKGDEKLLIEVFISDFHLERVKATFSWVLGLTPSLLDDKVELRMHSVSSIGITWASRQDFEARLDHEKRGVELIKKNSEFIRTISELYGFLLLGGHKGLNNYFKGDYIVSKGAGW